MVECNGVTYEIIEDVRNGFDQEVFEERYSEILKKYDYVVGDWGYDQLRLKGFYEDHHSKANFDMKISTLDDYIYEYCNFGCAYFVLRRVES
ncbi:MAG TPA: YutD family protein [Candidatus Avamphibacillus intestinigallinarum]|nr:YutD family protein [Candidatus Avamphibacillus intestinigallinarum]